MISRPPEGSHHDIELTHGIETHSQIALILAIQSRPG
jgi:hypothetical protein